MFRLLLRFTALVSLLMLAPVPGRSQETEEPKASPLLPQDEVLDIRLDQLPFQERFPFLAKEFARSPRPHVKARYAEYLLQGKHWGGPEDSRERGLLLAQEAMEEGSLLARVLVGWELMTGRNITRDAGRGFGLLLGTARAGSLDGLLRMGDASSHGLLGQPSVEAATHWFRRAAFLGRPEGLYRLASEIEDGKVAGPPDLPKACELYYEASLHGSLAAKLRLEELNKSGNPHSQRAADLRAVWYAAHGADMQTSKVKEIARRLESAHPADPVVLVALGRLHQSGQSGFRDTRKAYALFEKAVELGSSEGRNERAALLAAGRGVKADPARALAEWRDLAERQYLPAYGWIGYYRHWGTLKGTDLAKDAALAFADSKRAADAGDFQGQVNLALAYEFGIGVEMNYALAARYNRALAARGWIPAFRKTPQLLAHVPR